MWVEEVLGAGVAEGESEELEEAQGHGRQRQHSVVGGAGDELLGVVAGDYGQGGEDDAEGAPAGGGEAHPNAVAAHLAVAAEGRRWPGGGGGGRGGGLRPDGGRRP